MLLLARYARSAAIMLGQITQWDFQNKGKSGWTQGKKSFVLEVPLRYLRPRIIYSVPCDRILQRAHYRIKLDEVKKLLDSWFWGLLSIMGKIQVIKSPAVSKFVHLLTTLPTPYDSFLKELETLFVIKKMGDCR